MHRLVQIPTLAEMVHCSLEIYIIIVKTCIRHLRLIQADPGSSSAALALRFFAYISWPCFQILMHRQQ